MPDASRERWARMRGTAWRATLPLTRTTKHPPFNSPSSSCALMSGTENGRCCLGRDGGLEDQGCLRQSCFPPWNSKSNCLEQLSSLKDPAILTSLPRKNHPFHPIGTISSLDCFRALEMDLRACFPTWKIQTPLLTLWILSRGMSYPSSSLGNLDWLDSPADVDLTPVRISPFPFRLLPV